jgi:DNA polymerase V
MGRGGARPGAGRPPKAEKTTPLRVPENMRNAVLAFVANKGHKMPLYSSKVAAGFPAPSDDHIEIYLDLNELLVKDPAQTFLVRAKGESMLGAGIQSGDILVVDNSVAPSTGKVVIAAVDGQLTVKRLQKNRKGDLYLMPENDQFPPIELNAEQTIHIWGVVTNVIHAVR